MNENKKTPKIRFKGFTDVWEQRKLEDITQIVMGQSPDSINYTENSDDTVLIQGNADLNNGIVVPRIWSSQITKKSYPNDIIFTVRAPVGEIARNPYFATIGRGVASFKGNDFLYQSLIQKKENNYWNNISAGSTFDSINSDQLKNVIIDLPKNNLEQEKIGELFTNLDNLITLHQRKYDKLVNIKKSMLEKMFPKNSSNMPEIRFKGFTDVWEQRKLDKLLEQYTEVTTINNQYPALTSSRKGIFFQTEYFAGNQIASLNNVGYNIVPRNYFTYRHMSDDEIFHFNINDICDFGIVSTLYPVFTTKKELDSKYLQYQLNYGKEFTKFSSLQKQGGSRTYMYFAKLKELVLTMPKVEEQTKISSILSNIDNLITLHQRKLEKLNQIKKSLLEKMFV